MLSNVNASPFKGDIRNIDVGQLDAYDRVLLMLISIGLRRHTCVSFKKTGKISRIREAQRIADVAARQCGEGQ